MIHNDNKFCDSFVLKVNNRNNDSLKAIIKVDTSTSYKTEIDSSTEIISNQLTIIYSCIDSPIISIDRANHKFVATYHCKSNKINLTNSAFFLDVKELRSHRLGTFFLSYIIQWAKQWPSAEVKQISLSAGQAYSDNKERRNKCYENTGLTFQYTDPLRGTGESCKTTVSELKVVDSWKQNISKIDSTQYIQLILRENKSLESSNSLMRVANKRLANDYLKKNSGLLSNIAKKLFNRG